MENLQLLPKVRDQISSLYIEHGRIDRSDKSVAVWDDTGMTAIPAASLCVLMLGPGTTITHAAVQALADNNCLVIWAGEENVRFYACGTGGTRSAQPLLLQARLASDEGRRLEVVKRMYQMRFTDTPQGLLSVEALRGMEGIRVRRAYAEASTASGVEWNGRDYDRGSWQEADPVNRALSCANSCLYGICHAAILASGYSPGIGFIHTGKQLSFVYDIADLYKVDITIPLAFQMAQEPPPNLERAVRLACRDTFRRVKLLQRIVPDIQKALDVRSDPSAEFAPDTDSALPTALWTPAAELAVGTDLEDEDN